MGHLLTKEKNFSENHFAVKYWFLSMFWKKTSVSANAQNTGSNKKKQTRKGDPRDGRRGGGSHLSKLSLHLSLSSASACQYHKWVQPTAVVGGPSELLLQLFSN